eukprot:TRINITY_DN22351_c0_g2_i2.p1 TRINITY_DN22351_c0_g2~~TRINITY_DN22351_c0_g2_i2.p1  ORF type:complete len:494 (-),score=92.20 TRINITY_DN22351_c0_g2_i2:281-1678(-)
MASSDSGSLLAQANGESSDEGEVDVSSSSTSRRTVVRAVAAGVLLATALACYAGWTRWHANPSEVAGGVLHGDVVLMSADAVDAPGCGSWSDMCGVCGEGCCGEADCIEQCSDDPSKWQCKSDSPPTPGPPPYTKAPTPPPSAPSPRPTKEPTPPPSAPAPAPPTPPTPPGGEYHVGYYCIAQNCLTAKSDFGDDLKDIAIHAGSFDKADTAPPDMTGINPGQGNYMVLGGDGTSGTCEAEQVANWAASMNYQGIDFDMEGYMHVDDSIWDRSVSKVIDAVKRKFKEKGLPDPKFQMTVYTNGAEVAAKHHAELDRIGYMTYGNCMNNGISVNPVQAWDWCLPCDGIGDVKASNTAAYIAQLADKGVPKEKTVLAMTYCGLAGYQVNYYKSLIKDEGYKGLTFWNGFSSETSKCASAGCVPKLDFGNSVTFECITNMNTQCSDSCNPSQIDCPCPGLALGMEMCV